MARNKQESLKIRVWDNNKKVYYYNKEVDDLFASVPYSKIISNPNFVIEQATGIKDKEGNLVYENDVVCWNSKGYFVHRHQGGGEGQAVDDNYATYVLSYRIKNPSEYCIYNMWDGNDVAVKGNIHENADLIGKKLEFDPIFDEYERKCNEAMIKENNEWSFKLLEEAWKKKNENSSI